MSHQVIIWAQPLFLWDFSSEDCRVDASGEGAGGTCTFIPFYDSASIRASLGLNAINLKPADTRKKSVDVALDVSVCRDVRVIFFAPQKVLFVFFKEPRRGHIFFCVYMSILV